MKKIIFVLTMLVATVSASAQHVKESGVFDNTYVSISAGLTNPTTNWEWDLSHGQFVLDPDSYIRPMFQVEFGKELNTYYTVALEFDTRVNTTNAKTAFDETMVSWLHKVNVLNLFGGYKERKIGLYPMAGIGWGHNFANHDDYATFLTALELDWNLNEKWALLAKPQIRWKHASPKLNVNNSDVSLSLGVKYTFKNADGSRGVRTCNYDELLLTNDVLNKEINDLRALVETQKNTIGDQHNRILEFEQHKCPVNEVVVDNTVVPAIGFLVNDYKVTPDKMAHLYTIAEKYKNSKIVVAGYADKNTGTIKYNKELSLKRAQAVKSVLVGFGMSESNIEVKAMGDTEQPFADNDMNRVVIIEK